MAKEKKVAETETATKAAAEAKAPRGVTYELNGKTVRRLDRIRELWATKQHTRGEIRKIVADESGTEFPYQIVFSATKGLEGGKVVEKAPKADKKAKKEAEAA